MGILDKIKRAADPRARIVSRDLSRLDAVQYGLGTKATNYVLGGDDETVLSTIARSRFGLCKRKQGRQLRQ